MTDVSSSEIQLSTAAAMGDFALHALVGSVVFLLIAIPAIAIDFGLQSYVDSGRRVSMPVLLTLFVVEYGILISDVVLFAAFIVRITHLAVVRLFR